MDMRFPKLATLSIMDASRQPIASQSLGSTAPKLPCSVGMDNENKAIPAMLCKKVGDEGQEEAVLGSTDNATGRKAEPGHNAVIICRPAFRDIPKRLLHPCCDLWNHNRFSLLCFGPENVQVGVQVGSDHAPCLFMALLQIPIRGGCRGRVSRNSAKRCNKNNQKQAVHTRTIKSKPPAFGPMMIASLCSHAHTLDAGRSDYELDVQSTLQDAEKTSHTTSESTET